MAFQKDEKIIESWKRSNFSSFVTFLDSEAERLAESGGGNGGNDGNGGRRAEILEMIEKVKNSNESGSNVMMSLIKKFQEEVDFIEDRCCQAERAFLEAYRGISGLRDPTEILIKSTDLESQLDLLKLDLSAKVEQLDKMKVSEKQRSKELGKLQALVSHYDKNIDDTLNERMVKVTHKLAQEADERVAAAEHEKEAKTRKVAELQEKNEKLRRRLEETESEIFDLTQLLQSQTKDHPKEEHENMLEMWKQRALVAENEAREAKSQQGQDNALNDGRLEELERQLEIKDLEMSRILENLTKEQEEMRKLEAQTNDKITSLETSLVNVTEEKERLKRQAADKSDYDVIKQELQIMRSLEEWNENEEDEQKDPKLKIEAMITLKNKRLQSDNASLRLNNQELQKQLDTSNKNLGTLQDELKNKTSLVTQMELDLEKLQRPETTTVDLLKDAINDENVEATSDLVPIIQAQRERFKNQKEELEEQVSLLKQQLEETTQTTMSLRTDNVALYQKIRFLQGFQKDKTHQNTVIDVYKDKYEEKLDPFSSFERQERQRKLENLNVVEKMILWMVRFVMANKIARILVFFYSILLHILVFVVLMRMAINESHVRQVAEAMEWRDKYNQHMMLHQA